MDEQARVDAARRGDVPAFNDLVLCYQGRAYNVALRFLGQPDAAEDATQDAFLSVYRASDSFCAQVPELGQDYLPDRCRMPRLADAGRLRVCYTGGCL